MRVSPNSRNNLPDRIVGTQVTPNKIHKMISTDQKFDMKFFKSNRHWTQLLLAPHKQEICYLNNTKKLTGILISNWRTRKSKWEWLSHPLKWAPWSTCKRQFQKGSSVLFSTQRNRTKVLLSFIKFFWGYPGLSLPTSGKNTIWVSI